MSNEKSMILASEKEIDEKLTGLRLAVEQSEVRTDEEAGAVVEKIKIVKTIGKFFRSELEKYTKPAKEIIKTAQARFLPLENECSVAEELLKAKVNLFLEAKEAERVEAENKITKKLEEGKIKEGTALKKLGEVGEEVKKISSGGATLSRREVRVAVIVSPELIPDEYWVVDEVKVKKVALAGVDIPGVEVRTESQVAIR
jgi:hypothetical protein